MKTKQINLLKGFEEVLDIYTIDEEGHVYSESKKGFLKPGDNGKGYLLVSLKLKNQRKWKKAYIHRLVALAFLPKKDGANEVNHIDEDKSNNAKGNLEWTTRLENVRHGSGVKRGVENRTELIYVYDFMLNLVGTFQGMNQATLQTLGYSETHNRNKRIKEYYFLNKPIKEVNIAKIIEESSYQSVVIENVITGEKKYFANNRRAREFFDNKVNVTNAIQGKWLVKKKYRIYPLDYNELKDSPNLHE